MLLVGIGTELMASKVKSILNQEGQILIVLESGIKFTQEEVEDYVASQSI